MNTSVPMRRMTPEEYLHDPVSQGPGELVRGEARIMTPASPIHGKIVGRLFAALNDFVEAHDLGEVFPDNVGFELPGLDRTVRSPDVAFVRTDALPPNGLGAGWMPAAPDLAVEVLSPSETRAGLEEKLRDYQTAGTTLMWIVNPASRTVTVRNSRGEEETLSEQDVLTGGDLLPGFSLPIARLFAKLAR